MEDKTTAPVTWELLSKLFTCEQEATFSEAARAAFQEAATTKPLAIALNLKSLSACYANELGVGLGLDPSTVDFLRKCVEAVIMEIGLGPAVELIITIACSNAEAAEAFDKRLKEVFLLIQSKVGTLPKELADLFGKSNCSTCGSNFVLTARLELAVLVRTFLEIKAKATQGIPLWSAPIMDPLMGLESSEMQVTTLQGHTGSVNSLDYATDGSILASGGGGADGTVRIWDATSGQNLAILPSNRSVVTAVAFSPDGRILAVGSSDRTITLWDRNARKNIAVLRGHTGPVNSLAYSPDGKLIVSASEDKTIRLWDTTVNQNTAILEGHTWVVASVSFSPDGRTFATGSWDKTVKVWEAERGKDVLTLEGHQGLVRCVAYNPNGRLLASGCNRAKIKLWDTSAGTELATLHGHHQWINALAFSPDGNVLASGSTDKAIKLWDVGSWREIRTLRGHASDVNCLRFNADGTILASGSGDMTVRLWHIGKKQEGISDSALPDESPGMFPGESS